MNYEAWQKATHEATHGWIAMEPDAGMQSCVAMFQGIQLGIALAVEAPEYVQAVFLAMPEQGRANFAANARWLLEHAPLTEAAPR